MNNVDIEERENKYELFYRVLAQIPIVIAFILMYIIEYVMTIINIVCGPIQQYCNSLTTSADDDKLQ